MSTAKSKNQEGGVVIEFALVMVLLLSIAAGTLAFGRAFWYADALTKATRDGARLLSTWPITTNADTTAGVTAATNTVVSLANAANLSPPLTGADVVVACAYSAFTFVPCSGAVKPINVRVGMSGFPITLGEWFPFVSTSGVNNSSTINLSPHTTMRYMN